MDKQQQYFHFIEALFYWESQLKISVLEQHFSLSRPSAQKQLKSYLSTYNVAARYCESSKAWILKEAPFKPQLISEEFNEYARLIGVQDLLNLSGGQVLQLPLPHRQLKAQILRPILTACRNQTALEINYQSLQENQQTERIIRPHTLVNAGTRFHLRAYCEKSDAFKDFSLSRIISAEADFNCKARRFKQDDEQWQQEVKIEIKPDPRLSEYAQSVIAHDFEMTNNRAELTTNAALLNYIISLLRLDIQHPIPEAQQIVLTPECFQGLRQQRLLWNV